MLDVFSIKDFTFPKDFFWGSGYAGHQVEGNNVHSHKWVMETQGNWPEKSGLACNSYELYEKDFDIAQSLSHQAFRTSVEWSRIEPHEGEFCQEAADHYVKMFASLKARGMKVFCTLVHMSFPDWFHKLDSFNKLENVKYFLRYVEYIVPKIAPYVDYWNVLNEHNLVPKLDYRLNSVIFHAKAYHVIKKYSNAPVSSAHALVYYQPYRPHDKWDQMMANYYDMQHHEFFFHAIRTGELVFPFRDVVYDKDIKNSCDFWSINSYVRSLCDARKKTGMGANYEFADRHFIDIDFYLQEFNPECIIANLSRLTDKPVIITENGMCCTDDRQRIVWLTLYLCALSESIRMGIDVKGYLYWSLLDNYEWWSYAPTFGLCKCDLETFERTPKPSAYFYQEIIKNNGFNQDILRKFLNEIPSGKDRLNHK